MSWDRKHLWVTRGWGLHWRRKAGECQSCNGPIRMWQIGGGSWSQYECPDCPEAQR